MDYYNTLEHDQNDSHETVAGSPLSDDENAVADAPSPKKRRIARKRVITVAMTDGDVYPPADSWAWRKYGQKPIKGSSYPRGYYRCSSVKGCTARKQVERSRKDLTTVVITYAGEHNHHIPSTTNHSQTNTTLQKPQPEELAVLAEQPDVEPDNINFAEFVADFGYFNNITSGMLKSPVTASPRFMEPDTALIFTRADDEDALFADPGEIPGCSLIFQRDGRFLHSLRCRSP